MRAYDPAAIEERWQRAWEQARAFEAERKEGRAKFFIIFAYPGISGFLHVGHMRGYTYCDAIARYHRHLGENVLFPAGFHASGIPAVSFARKVERRDAPTLEALVAEGTDESTIERLKDPLFVVEFFKGVYEARYWRKFGFSIDYRRLCSTVDPGYARFIQWQFRRLKDNGLLVQKPHFAPFCPASGPVAVDPSETDVARGGDAEVLQFCALKFRTEEGVVFPCATLRPETVFGATNLWVNPAVAYVLADVQGERWVLSPEALRKADLLFEGGAKEVGRVAARDLVGKTVAAPATGRRVRVMPAPFVEPGVGTGVVMSVPGHAPYDFEALEELRAQGAGGDRALAEGLSPVVIIRSPGEPHGGPAPAEAAVRARKVASLADRAALDAATEDVYTLEFHQGRMLENTGDFAGLSCAQARERILRETAERGESVTFPEFSKEVVCRCGQQVLIKRIPDQWFIRYSDEALTRASAEHARTMSVTPPEYARDLPSTLEWFADRACIRQGAWLGTKFPLDERWVIEPIADSTLYPAFYTVSLYLNRGELAPEALSDALFDHVFLGRGRAEDVPGVSAETLEALRRDFLYWYPLDVNLGGKEHKTVHFPAFIKNHVGVLAREHWPRGIFVNYWVTMREGAKISKSKGGVRPVAELTAKFGVDALRLYYAHAAAPWLDVEWDPDGVVDYELRLARIHDAVAAIAGGDLNALGANTALPESATLDRWLRSTLARRIEEAREGWRALDFRQVATPVFFGLPGDLRWYLRRGGRNLEALRAFADAWAVLQAPITPHLAEELHAALGGKGLVLDAPMPQSAPGSRDREAESVERYLEALLEDTQRIRQVAESFALTSSAVEALEVAAGRTLRGELVGLAEPIAVPGPARRGAQGGQQGAPQGAPLAFGAGAGAVAVFIQARRAASLDDVEKAARAAAQGSGGLAWVVALQGAPPAVRARASELGVLFTGPPEFDALCGELGVHPRRPIPKRIRLVSAELWKAKAFARTLADASAHGKADAGRVLKALASEELFKPHMKAAPKVVQEAVKDAASLKPEQLNERLGALSGLDEYALLEASRPFLASEYGCPVEVLSGENPEARSEPLRAKAEAALPLRPAIAIEY